MKKKQISLVLRIILIMMFILIINAVSIGAFGYMLNRTAVIDLNAAKAMTIARNVVCIIDTEEFKEIMLTKEKNEHWYEIKAFTDKVYAKDDLMYLYILDNNYSDTVTYFAEGASPQTGEAEGESALDLGDTESVEYFAAEMFETMENGIDNVTSIYSADEYGKMVSGFAAIVDSNGAVVGVVGADISIDDTLAFSDRFGIYVIIYSIISCVIIGLIIRWYLIKIIGKPVSELAALAEKISMGDISVKTKITRSDEIGVLSHAFIRIVESNQKQAMVFTALADGDLSVDIEPRCKNDVTNTAIAKMVVNLNTMLSKIISTTVQVSTGSNQMLESSQFLVQGSIEQTAAVEKLSGSISDITQKTCDNADTARKAANLADIIKNDAEKSSSQMDEMMRAVNEINQASQSINKVLKVIDDIAFQTNILALNAAVEAARAGQYGKGFAVVAEEVRNLASKSAEAAKDTGILIANSIEKTEFGTRIASETSASLADIVSGIKESSTLIKSIADSSELQSDGIVQINKSIEQIMQVVQKNNAAAEENTAMSGEMSGQAHILEKLTSQFKLK